MVQNIVAKLVLLHVLHLFLLEQLVPMRDFTMDQLKQHDGSNADLPMLISIRGVVFDVSTGKQFYGPNGKVNVKGDLPVLGLTFICLQIISHTAQHLIIIGVIMKGLVCQDVSRQPSWANNCRLH